MEMKIQLFSSASTLKPNKIAMPAGYSASAMPQPIKNAVTAEIRDSALPQQQNNNAIPAASVQPQLGSTTDVSSGPNGSNSNQNWRVAGEKRRKKGVSFYGKGNSNLSNGRQLGAILPSRHFVLERILKNTTKEELTNCLKEANPQVNIRSLELLTKSSLSRYHMYKLEVSIEDVIKVMDPNNIPAGIGIRPFWFKKQEPADSNNS